MTVRPARRSSFLLIALATLAALLPTPSYAAEPSPAPQTSGTAQPAPALKPPKDRTPPAPATDLRLAANDAQSISLTWTNPTDADFAGVLIRRSNSGAPPISAKDGVLVAVPDARQTAFTDSGLTAGHRYSYAVFTRDKTRNVGVPALLSTATRSRNTATGVRGKVTDQEGRPIKDVFVEIREAETGDYMAHTRTSSSGQFLATGLTAGTYRICYLLPPGVRGHSPLGYRPACYRQQLEGPGTPVVVETGKITSGLVDYLHVAGAISGRVTDSAGNGIANVWVVSSGTEWWHGRAAVTGPDGTYTITGLVEDTYYVCFDGPSSGGTSPTGYLGECYDNQPPSDSGTSIPVTLGQISTGIDATLEAAGAITGRVTDGNGVPVADVAVSVDGGPSTAYAGTDSTGAYTIKGLATGSHTVCFDGSYMTTAQAPYGFTNTCDAGGAIADVTAGETTTLNGRLEAAGAIGGTVSGDDGPLAGVWVRVTNSMYTVDRSATTDENGNYQLTGLPPGEVTVCFNPTYSAGGYLPACYGDETGSASPVTISSGQLSTADIQLQRGASITGTVTDASGAPIADVIVVVSDGFYSAVTDESGNYTLGGLAAGSYQICFDPFYARGPAADGYAAECYDNQPSGETADPVAVGGPGSVTVVNAALSPGAAVTGRITGSDGAALEGVYVYATSVDYSMEQQVATTRYDGSYSVRNVSEGDYYVCFDAVDVRQPATTGYANECFDDHASSTSYTVVHVAAGSVTTGIDAVLAVGAEVTGHVTDAAGIGIAWVSVEATRPDGSYLGSYGFTDGNGRYQIAGLPPTAVAVCFSPMDGAHLSECYDNQPDVSTATAITLSSGAVRSGVDAVLAEAPRVE